MKPEHDYKVYFFDQFGAERLACTVSAKSPGHAMAIARRLGHTRLHEAVPTGGPSLSELVTAAFSR
ncbi:MAG: hypothetical protein EON55_13325 [Alphaproteobacteria bacterium]|nr:MAG: hypothetical protein EON55_13325 [Alphaproteobacteria bacterium]